ncbi:LacI family DNA-binding transcriptional regulator [Poriferisphaera sp. WC338]|uniref:LacI family DNA-binding transcriptional regulator n=1 Tax=Poriferisphaera sp. WC338 TaxID=3425129 RepID=UPI003D8178C4
MSLLEVATLAGVSQATVSKVIHNYPSVSQHNIDRVREAMSKLNYQPSGRKRKSGSKGAKLPVAVLIVHVNMFHHYASTCPLMLKGVEQALRARGLDMILAHVKDVKDLPTAVANRQVSGLVLIGHEPSEEVLEKIEDVPSVWLTSHHDVTGDMMLAGNEAVGRLAAEYLMDRGHEKLGILNALTQNSAMDLRTEYFKFVAGSRRCAVKEYLSDSPDGMGGIGLDVIALEERVTEVVDRFLKDKPRVTGLFVPHDMQVAMVYRVLDKRGVRPGRNLEIVGCDDEKAALIGLNPRPASVNIGSVTMGQRAVEQLFWRIDNREDEQRVRVMVEPELVPGDG